MDLKAYQWQNRLILLFAPSETHHEYRALNDQIQARKSEIDDRDILVFRMLESGGVGPSEDRSKTHVGKSLRERFSIRPGKLTVVLIGKDGGEKLRQEDRFDLEEILELIDTMPMRQREMRERARKPSD
jgi:hypothetical protein